MGQCKDFLSSRTVHAVCTYLSPDTVGSVYMKLVHAMSTLGDGGGGEGCTYLSPDTVGSMYMEVRGSLVPTLT